MANFTDLSVDLETLGTEPGAVITQIGLGAFNTRPILTTHDKTGLEIAGQRIDVDPQSCLAVGMHVAWATISWWLQQEDEARESMARSHGHNIAVALHEVNNFIKNQMADDFKIWGNGATFDVTLLNEAYRKCYFPVPWKFRNIRDMRTLVAVTPGDKIMWGVAKVAHDAMADAVAQAETIRSCFAVQCPAGCDGG
jgi:hypothetical protein